jgi:hypothetical protein
MEEPPPGSSKAAAARAPRVVGVLAGLLERAAERGDTATPTLADSAFRGRALPGIPVRRYAERIYRYAGCSPACYVVAYVYLDRLARGRRDAGAGEDEDEDEAAVVGIDSYTVHRLLITSVLVAVKFMDDRYVTYISINLSYTALSSPLRPAVLLVLDPWLVISVLLVVRIISLELMSTPRRAVGQRNS